MGSRKFYHTIISKTAIEGFNFLSNEAEKEYGHMQGYSGAINVTSLGSCIKQFEKCSKTVEKQAEKIACEHLEDNSRKGIANYINCGVVKIELITVKRKKGNYKQPVYKDIYCLYSDSEQWPYKEYQVTKRNTSKEANEYATEYALKKGMEVIIRKQKTLVDGETTIAEVNIERKELKTIPKNIKPNQRIERYYKFIFFGEASY